MTPSRQWRLERARGARPVPKVLAALVAFVVLRLLAAAGVDVGVLGLPPATVEGLLTLGVMYLCPTWGALEVDVPAGHQLAVMPAQLLEPRPRVPAAAPRLGPGGEVLDGAALEHWEHPS